MIVVLTCIAVALSHHSDTALLPDEGPDEYKELAFNDEYKELAFNSFTPGVIGHLELSSISSTAPVSASTLQKTVTAVRRLFSAVLKARIPEPTPATTFAVRLYNFPKPSDLYIFALGRILV